MKIALRNKLYKLIKILTRVPFWQGLLAGALVLLLLIYPYSGATQENPSKKTLQVATRVIPPFVFQDKDKLSGFSIDLWRSVANEMGASFKFTVYPTVPDILNQVEQNKVDLGIAAISITAERQKKFDFSFPMFAAGLQILVRSSEEKTNIFPNLLQTFFSPTLLQMLGIAGALILIAAHIIWLFERHHQEAMISKSYFPGIFKASWWAAATLATQADEMPKGPLGRMIAIIWMFIGVIFVAYFTATVTTAMTVQQLQGDIRGIEDLPGRVVVTTAGSTASEFLRQQRIKAVEVGSIENAYETLLKNQADALVFDSPVLLYYAANEGKGKVEIVGSVFQEENYGIVLPSNSPYRRQINSALLTLKENGIYKTLYEKWFDVKKS
ncbi:MAG: transporter substrate-binding domain-containing protein [Calothrix sp. FI2-JRJ7]|jgi:polar amino acid transport system substrate-binding protein|nr:transporter substrate-binding domain-containing protein [Calothrix sp. FI2-JRJ7]